MKRTISTEIKSAIFQDLAVANLAFQQIYPGDLPLRQPVHTVYGGAHIFKSDTAHILGKLALQSLEKYAPDAAAFAEAFDLSSHAKLVYEKVLQKLKTEAVEDFRIDFEDGFGNRPDPEEDAAAENAALEVAKGMAQQTLPPFIGIRIKPFTEDLKERSLRTLDIFLSTLLAKTNGSLPQNFVTMLPKVTIPEQIEALVKIFELFEGHFSLPPGSLKLEIMVETTQSMLDASGTNPLRRFVLAGKSRCVACHFGTYDYTAACGITAKYQTMSHPVCDFAHHVTKVALAQTGVWLSDGATNVLPVGIHPDRGRDEHLTENQQVENRQAVHRAWRQAFDHVRHSLWNGFYQGWDLHPAQLPARYAAVFSFFLESLEDATLRLRSFVEKSARASLTGDIFDDAATGQGLLNYFLRGLNCGAISPEDALATGLTLAEIRSRSFLKILENLRK